jgi:5-methylcytosine-specific restriction endonuclease McrA
MKKTWTEAFVLARIRQTLRRLSMYMPSISLLKREKRRKYVGPNKRLKFEYPCAKCGEWFPEKNIQVDHIVPAGSLRTFDDVGEFARRLLFCGIEGLQILCSGCHTEKTNEENRLRKSLLKTNKVV